MTDKDTVIKLNQIHVSLWNYKKIGSDYDIYQVVLDKYSDKNILNTTEIAVRILSAVYYSGQQTFVMTPKGCTDEISLQHMLNKVMNGSNRCSVRQIRLEMLAKRPDQLRKLFGYRNRALLQLLINSTLNSIFPDEQYQNITGRCYYYNPDWNEDYNDKIELVDLTLERDMVMYPAIVTFVKAKPTAVHMPERVVLDPRTITIRKALKGDPENIIYYRQGIEGTHGSRAYDGTTLLYWEKSRLSCVARFFTSVREELKQYVSFDFTDVDTAEVSTADLTLGDEGIGNVLRSNGIRLVDSTVISENEKDVSDDKKQKVVLRIEESCKAYKDSLKAFCDINDIHFSIGEKDLYSLNIEIVRSEKFYKIYKDLNDPYIPDKGVVCQHVTVPVSYKNGKGEVCKSFQERIRTVLKESVIKADLRDGRIRLVDWKRYNFRSPLSLYCARPCATDNDRKKGLRPVLFAGMTICPDGTFTSEVFKIDNIKSPVYADVRQKEISNCFFRENFGNSYFDRNVEIAVWEDNDVSRAYIFRRTNVRAMSNIIEMERSFMDEKEDVLLDTDVILSAIDGLQYDKNPSNEEVYYNIFSGVIGKEQILKSELLPLLYPSKREGQKKVAICTKAKEAIANATGVILKVGRRAEDSERLGTDVYRHIHLWESIEYDKEDSQEDIPSKVYCYVVGQYDTLNQSISTSPVMRQIVRMHGCQPCENDIKKYIELMQVGFVRMKNYTVLPFPAKYLREILNTEQ